MLHPKPFTSQELLKINITLDRLSKISDDILPDQLGFAGIETDIGINRIHKELDSVTKSKIRLRTVPIDQIYAQDQNGVGIENMRRVLANWSTVSMPELFALKIGKFWLNEGHHRIALQYLAGRRQIEANVEYKR